MTSKRETAELRRPPSGCTCDAGPRARQQGLPRLRVGRRLGGHSRGASYGQHPSFTHAIPRGTAPPCMAQVPLHLPTQFCSVQTNATSFWHARASTHDENVMFMPSAHVQRRQRGLLRQDRAPSRRDQPDNTTPLQPHCCSRSNTPRAAQAHPAGARETVRAKGRARTLAEGVSRSALAPTPLWVRIAHAQAGLMAVYAVALIGVVLGVTILPAGRAPHHSHPDTTLQAHFVVLIRRHATHLVAVIATLGTSILGG